MGDSRADPVSARLRTAEREIDAYYKRNHLVKLPFAVAAWHLMVSWEDAMLVARERAQQTSTESSWAAIADNLVFGMQYPFRWLWRSCASGGTVPQVCTRGAYDAAQQLLRLGDDYVPFAIAFTYASRHMVELELDGSMIRASPGMRPDIRYAAYDLLARRVEPIGEVELADLIEVVERSFRESGGAFTYDLSPRSVRYASETIAPLVQRKFTLPDDWEFEGYSMGEFRKAWTCLEAIAYLHHAARLIAARRGTGGVMHAGSVFAPRHEELLKRIERYSGVPERALASLVGDLTYGARGVRRPDPAIQSLIRLNNVQYGIMPSLVMASSSERNLTVLLNRLPAQRDHYLRLVSRKEDLMRQRIKQSLQSCSIRFFQGNIPDAEDLPDIDLALISDSERLCLVLELKWFIEPAEVRELVEKSEEIRKGISQLLLLRRATVQNETPALRVLEIDATYELCFAVVSANSIGIHTVQHHEVPVVRESDLVRKVLSTDRLRDVSAWLSTRSFLPREGAHYEVVEETHTIGQWSLQWYGFRLLVGDDPA